MSFDVTSVRLLVYLVFILEERRTVVTKESLFCAQLLEIEKSNHAMVYNFVEMFHHIVIMYIELMRQLLMLHTDNSFAGNEFVAIEF